MNSDVECRSCGTVFNRKKNATYRVVLKFQVDNEGKVEKARIAEHSGIR